MEKTMYDLLMAMSDEDAEFSENALVFIKEPIKISAPARITVVEPNANGGWGEITDGGVHDGKIFIAAVSYFRGFMHYDWTLEDVFYEVRERRCNILRYE
jgi:hypothetical protein